MLKFLLWGLIFTGIQAFGALDSNDQKTLDNAFEQYEDLHAAFFKYDGAKAQTQAKKLFDILGKIQDPQLSKHLEFSRNKIKNIKKDNSRDANNQNLHLVSMALIYVLNKYEFDKKAHYKSFTCPMVNMRWIQNIKSDKDVQNPYAPGMPSCGGQDR